MRGTQRLLGCQIKSLYRVVDGDHTCVASASGVTWDRPPLLHSKCCCFLSVATTSLSRTNYLTSCLTPEEARKEFASERRNISILVCFSAPFLLQVRGRRGSFLSITFHNKLFIYWISVLPLRVSLNPFIEPYILCFILDFSLSAVWNIEINLWSLDHKRASFSVLGIAIFYLTPEWCWILGLLFSCPSQSRLWGDRSVR